jgi:hypothetical protein
MFKEESCLGLFFDADKNCQNILLIFADNYLTDMQTNLQDAYKEMYSI